MFYLRFLPLLLLCACSFPQKQANPLLEAAKSGQLTQQESKQVSKEALNNWRYGKGLGTTILKAGTAIAFPPYLLVLASNAALNVAGYEAVGPDNFLPEKGAKAWNTFYDGVTSVPGRVTAGINGQEFRDDKVAEERINRIINKEDPSNFSDI